jgi:malonate decarboxylase gamma subunit
MSEGRPGTSRGRTWFEALTGAVGVGSPRSILCCDAPLGDEQARFLAVVPDAHNRFPRARAGEVGVEEAWGLAQRVREVIESDAHGTRRPLIAIVDVVSQAYGRLEELLGIHLAGAAAVDAYTSARIAGHPVLALLVGRAVSGAFLAHGAQANRILALSDPGVVVHAMGKAAAARVTRRSVAEIESLGELVPPMSYDIRVYADLGLLDGLITGVDADAPSTADVARVAAQLASAVEQVRAEPHGGAARVHTLRRRPAGSATLEVRQRMLAQWMSAP